MMFIVRFAVQWRSGEVVNCDWSRSQIIEFRRGEIECQIWGQLWAVSKSMKNCENLPNSTVFAPGKAGFLLTWYRWHDCFPACWIETTKQHTAFCKRPREIAICKSQEAERKETEAQLSRYTGVLCDFVKAGCIFC